MRHAVGVALPMWMGSTYAPALKASAEDHELRRFLGVVASGRKNVGVTAQESVAPAFGDNPTRRLPAARIDLYVYLRSPRRR